VTPPPATPSPIAVEQALLGQAVKVLRDGHDARTALALLAQHAQQFPHGALVSEESMLRVEALLALGRHAEALSVLDRSQLASLPNREEQLVVRGELRAANGRWREAKQDFDEALGTGRSLPAASAKLRTIQERALWGRASARSRLGDEDGARTDLELYLKHFPGGRFAASAASSLKGKP
jgi:tetratricopeptide (TPR) repeat protein